MTGFDEVVICAIVIVSFRWTLSTPPKVGTRVSVPPLRGDELRSSTVLPYLDAYHYGTDDMEQDYYTEHDLTGSLNNI